jgi:hypothetical protein
VFKQTVVYNASFFRAVSLMLDVWTVEAATVGSDICSMWVAFSSLVAEKILRGSLTWYKTSGMAIFFLAPRDE